jgi:hypothetical protein
VWDALGHVDDVTGCERLTRAAPNRRPPWLPARELLRLDQLTADREGRPAPLLHGVACPFRSCLASAALRAFGDSSGARSCLRERTLLLTKVGLTGVIRHDYFGERRRHQGHHDSRRWETLILAGSFDHQTPLRREDSR